jgi:hypothetical protein
VTALFWKGKNRELIWLGLIAGAVFGAQLILKQMGRSTRVAAEVVGALALTSTAPSAYCVALGRFDTTALALWLLNWLFAADQIHFVWLQIRGARAAGLGEKFRLGWSFMVAQILLIWMVALACHLRWLPEFIWIAFTPVLFRGFVWFAKRPRPIVVRHLGWTEMAHAAVFGVLLSVSFFVAP